MRMKQSFSILAILLAVLMLSACDGGNTSSVEETQPVTEATAAATEPKDRTFLVEPNAIEGLVRVEQMIPLKDNYLMVGVNEHGGQAVVLYDFKNNTSTPKTLNRLAEAGDILAIVPTQDDQVYVIYNNIEGGTQYVELYDSSMTLVSEVKTSEFVKENPDLATMKVDGAGNRYFLGWNEAGNHEVLVYDKDMQLLGRVSGEMTIGDELIPAADGKMYLLYHVGVKEARLGCVDPAALTITDIMLDNLPVYHKSTIEGSCGYDFYFNAQEALYGINIADGTSTVVLDWASTMFDGRDVRGLFALSDGNYLVSNIGSKLMEEGTWRMVAK